MMYTNYSAHGNLKVVARRKDGWVIVCVKILFGLSGFEAYEIENDCCSRLRYTLVLIEYTRTPILYIYIHYAPI